MTIDDGVTIEDAKAKRCPFGVSEFCLTDGCMAWRGREIETDWKRADEHLRNPMDEHPGPGWRLTLKSEPPVTYWAFFEEGGYCQRLTWLPSGRLADD